MTHSPLRTGKACLGAVFGGLSALTIFIPKMSAAAMIAVKTLTAAAVIYLAFGYESRRLYFKRLFIFWLMSFIFAGVGTAASGMFGGKMFMSRNGVIYADFSAAALVITSIAAYACIAVYKSLSDCSEEGAAYTVTVSDNGKVVSFRAIADTGNTLKDGFTGKPVIVCGRAVMSELYGNIPDSGHFAADYSPTGKTPAIKWRLIPYHTASGSGLIPIVCPRDICIKNDETGEIFSADACLGAASFENDPALLHPKILL